MIATIYFMLSPSLKEKTKKQIDEIEKKIEICNRKLSGLKHDYEHRILMNDFERETSGHLDISILDDKIIDMVSYYDEQMDLLYALYEGCVNRIYYLYIIEAKNYIPQTLKNKPILDVLKKNNLIHKILDCNKLSLQMIKDIDYKEYHKIKDYIKEYEGEKGIDSYFAQLNENFKKSIIINKYKKENNILAEKNLKLQEIINKEKEKLKNKLNLLK